MDWSTLSMYLALGFARKFNYDSTAYRAQKTTPMPPTKSAYDEWPKQLGVVVGPVKRITGGREWLGSPRLIGDDNVVRFGVVFVFRWLLFK